MGLFLLALRYAAKNSRISAIYLSKIRLDLIDFDKQKNRKNRNFKSVVSAITFRRFLGAYTVRYLFVTCGFSLAVAENLKNRFLLGRAPEADHLEPF